ncbi:hypothetical protein DVH05_025302 [Phytophthora capsici]|nr:hypothetical protein DVH05_025302 [Phytophthora capsici]
MDDSFDVAFLEEVSAFLRASEPVGSSTSVASPDSNCDLTAFPHTKTDDEAALKRKHKNEKKMLRKQRYERRLKQERESLREMEKLLTAELLSVKTAHDNRVVDRLGQINSVVRDQAQWERRERSRAEEEQKRLVEALTVQASYLAKLQELLPEQSKVFVMNTVRAGTVTYQTEKQLGCGC